MESLSLSAGLLEPHLFPMASPSTTSDWNDFIPKGGYAQRGRRVLDWILLALLLPPALALMFVIGVANLIVFRNLSQVLFLQTRIGWRGRPFQMFKFRTMKETDETEIGSWSGGNDYLRVTQLGRILRNTHMDELPQLFNILIGEMSFIGPRPEMVEIEAWASQAISGFSERLAIRPGVAGLAQITQGYTGRDVDAYREKLEINRFYLNHMSLTLDLSIVVRTAIWMVRGKGWQWNHGAMVPDESLEQADSQRTLPVISVELNSYDSASVDPFIVGLTSNSQTLLDSAAACLPAGAEGREREAGQLGSVSQR
ncbi:MAG: lipopolysaccharide/colanic/teichoic acid biosynthesis glycosyltransferase [Candidatus Paceibacteria bacterium]|jgi:lipopolysaccharide/colanic/teichoic acid biosynthesis glycosyltransferase